jgi:DNA repair protein RadD
VSKAGIASADASFLPVRGGEFVAEEVERLMDRQGLVAAACREIIELTTDRHAVLVFASGVVEAFERHGIEAGFVTGETPAAERDATLSRFKAGELKYLCNVNILATGFDAPNIDCVALLRPTLSPGLYYQMVGRGFRLHPDKQNCLVLDFGGNVLRHGPVDQVEALERRRQGNHEAPAKECPQCRALVAAGYARCPECGHEFPPPERQTHEAQASQACVLSEQFTNTEYEVRDIHYRVHTKRDAAPNAPKTMRVDYRLGLDHWQSEFICFEHDGYARQKAIQWWRLRSPDPVPDTAERAVEIAAGGGLAHAEHITVRSVSGERYDRIIAYKLSPMPEAIPADAFGGYDPDEIPF